MVPEVFLAVLSLLLLWLEWFLNYRSRARQYKSLPNPRGVPLFSHGLQLNRSQVDIFPVARRWAKTFLKEGLYCFWVWPIGQINIINPEDAETVLSNSKYNMKAFTYHFMKPWLRSGLLISEGECIGEHWFSRRKILTPAFHFKILKHFSVIIEENSQRFVRQIESEVEKDKTDIIPLIKHLTLDIICETAMGTKLSNISLEVRKNYEIAIEGMGHMVLKRLLTAWLWADCVFNILPHGWKQRKILQTVHALPRKVINERRAYRKEHGDVVILEGDDDCYSKFEGKPRMAMLDLLLTAEQEGQIDHEGVCEEVDTFMFEGHDTVSAGITFALFAIANDKKVQDRIEEELNSIFGDNNRAATMDDLLKMKYLERCIKEALRLYPPVPYMGRKINEEMKLRDYTIPANTQCHIHVFDLHRRPDIYPNPEIYDPDRFTQENSEKRHPYAYIPFSAGPRNCIGQKFAMLEMKSALQAIIREYELIPVTKPDDLVFFADLVLRTTHPVYVKFTKRKIINYKHI